MVNIQYFRHGSEDSLDEDVFFVVDKLSEIPQENKELCEKLSTEFNVNGNLITVSKTDSGLSLVTSCYKGTCDEVNNGLLYTYKLHDQLFPRPVNYPLRRDIAQKMLRVMRGILSQCSRTEHRDVIKKALRSDNIYVKLDLLSSIDISKITDFGPKKASTVEVHKFMSFQIIQFLGLMWYPSIEIFTKSDAAKFYPDASPFLYRQSCDVKHITRLQTLFIQGVECLLDGAKEKVTILQGGKFLKTPFGRLNVLTEKYEEQP